MAKSEGKSVNVTFNGPSIEHDELIGFSAARNDEDRKRASSAGESRAKIKEFLDDTGMNGKALSWLRQILKTADKDDGQAKAMDVIMSLKKGLPMVEAHVAGQGTGSLDLDGEEPAMPEHHDPDFDEEIKETMAEDDPDYDGDDPETKAESDEFMAEVDENMGSAA